MFRTILGWIGILWMGASALHADPPQQPSASTPSSQYRAVLNRYCVVCHNEKLKTANLMLDKMDVAASYAGSRGLGKGDSQTSGQCHAAARIAAARQELLCGFSNIPGGGN